MNEDESKEKRCFSALFSYGRLEKFFWYQIGQRAFYCEYAVLYGTGPFQFPGKIAEIPEKLYQTDPDDCCRILKVEPVRWAIEEMGVNCWVTGLRCTEGRTRTDYKEVEERDKGLMKLNPILLWKEREVWQYLALYNVPVNPLYKDGFRSLGCEPCTHISNAEDERAGRWLQTSKCGGECGIHTRPLKVGAVD